MADETNTVLKHFQIYRNNNVSVLGTESTHATAVANAKTKFAELTGLLDGELVLYRYKLVNDESTIHTIVGVHYLKVEDDNSISFYEILGNYDQLSAEYKAYVDSAIKDLDGSATIATVADGVVTLKAGIAETDGIIANNTATDITLAKVATTGTAADVAVATGIEGLTATTVQGALAELQGDIKGLQAIDPVVTTVAAGTGISVTSATTEGENDVTYTVAADFTVDTIKYGEDADVNKAGKTYIRIMDGDTVISETDATAFVKDGFLQKVELIEGTEEGETENVLRFTWNSDAGIQVTNIKVSELCDVYTADETYLHLNGFKFEHKTSGVTTGEYAANAANVTVDSTAEKSFKVPTLTVDAAGHVTAASEKTVTIKLPATIDTAVQTVSGNGYVSAEKSGTNVSLKLQTQEVETATAAGEGTPSVDGLATALNVKTYVDTQVGAANTAITNAIAALDANVTSADGTNVQVKVTEVDGVITAVNVVTDKTVNSDNVNTAITNAIEALDVESVSVVTNNNGVVTINGIKQDNGKIAKGTDDITLAKLATTGAAADVSIADTEGVIEATTVEGALAEIAKEINAMDYNVSDVEGFQPVAQGEKVKVTIQQKDGKITNVAVDETALETALDGLEAATTLEGVESIKVDYSETANTVSLTIDGTDKVLTQGTNGLLANVALSYGEEGDGKKYIKLTGKNGADLGKIDATDFIKDGMLQSATLETNPTGQEDGTYIKLVFNSDGPQDPIYINVTSLIDVYTADETYLHLNGYKFEHKTITGLDSTNSHGIVDNVTVNSTATQTFQVPTLKVDAAGHVVSVDEKTVTITLPASINTAVQTVTAAQTEVLSNTKYVAVKATRAENSNDVVLSTDYQTKAVADATADYNGLATAFDVKTYVDTKANTTIEALDVANVSVATVSDGIVTFNGIKQEDGKIATGTTGISLEKVATTGAAADVTYTRGSGESATNMSVQDVIAELDVDTWDAGTY